MSIDNPIEAREKQLAAAKREQLIPTKVAKTFVVGAEFFLRLAKAPIELSPLDQLSAFGKMFTDLRDQWTQSNADYLLEGIVPEVKRLMELYEGMSEKQRSFLDQEWPKLVAKAIDDSRYARDRRRLDRVAAILSHTGAVADIFSGDRTEEFIHAALELGEAEIIVLKMIYDTQAPASAVALADGRPLLRPDELFDHWREFESRLTTDQQIELPSLCRRLESFGFVATVGGGVGSLAAYGPWSLLLKGKLIVEHISKQVPTSEQQIDVVVSDRP
jgi:hypothetical protein